MKNTYQILIISTLVTLTISLSCKKEDAKTDIRDPTLAECLLSQIMYTEDTTTLYYNDEKKLVKLEWTTDEYMLILYDTEGKITQIDEYYSGQKTYYTSYTWTNNQAEAIYYELIQEVWVGKYKNIYEYNENNEVIKITDYSRDASNTAWVEYGDYYLYEWENGNITKAENWDNYSKSQPIVNKKQRRFFYSAKEIYHHRDGIKLKSDGYNLFSTTLFEYDSKINPFRYLTNGNIIAPDEFNSSRNNWTKITYTDINKQISSAYTFEYNDKNFPAKLIINNTLIQDGDTAYFSSTEFYQYDCK